MERTTESETKSKIVVFINERSTTVIPFANYVMSQDRGESFNSRRWLPTAGVGLDRHRLQAVGLFAVEDKRDRLMLRP